MYSGRIWKRHLEQHRRRDRAGQHLAQRHVRHVREQPVDRGEEEEDRDPRDEDREHVGGDPVVGHSRHVALEHAVADRGDDQAEEQHRERADHERERERLPGEEAAVRPAVDDVERRLEHAEQRQRGPDQHERADDPERGRVVLERLHDLDQRRHRALGERVAELGHEVARLVRAAREAEQRERQEEERHEREEREVGDHRREVRAAVGEELRDELPFAQSHDGEYRRCRLGA